jgi:hypothetical protein
MLPANGFRINIKIQTTVYKKGIYSKYAETLLGLTNFINENKSVSEIEKVEIKNTVIADNSQIFYVRSIGKNGVLPSLSYSWRGILLGVNLPPEPEKKSIKQSTSTLQNSFTQSKNETVFSFAETNTEDCVTEKTEQQKAKELAALIAESKKQRATLISGYSEVNYAPETIRFMYEKMFATENEYLQCFTGTFYKTSQTQEIIIDIKDTVSTYTVGTFTLDNEPIYLTLTRITSTAAEQIESFEKKNIDQVENTGFFVRLPQIVTATVKSDKRIYANEQLYVSQWGAVYSLPVGNFTIELNAYSGAVKTFRHL